MKPHRISGDWEGRTVLVHQYEIAQPTPPGEVVDSTTIEGQSVEIVAADSFGDLARFQCGEYGFDVGSFPAGWPSESRSDRSAVETFLVVLIPELACD